MASSTEIANLAISHLGIGKNIANLETERSQEANACRRFYDIARDMVLRDYAWPFASKIIALGLIEESPNTEWLFSYRYPSDCLNFRRILSSIRNVSNDTRVPYKISEDTSGLLLFTDMQDAVCEYTMRADDPLRYPPDFTMAFSFRLAAYVAPQITSGDRFKLTQQMVQLYQVELGLAKANAANEEQVEPLPDSEFIRARD